VSELTVVPSVKFEIMLPTVYTDPEDSANPKFVQHVEIADYLNEMTAKYREYGGYTMSNPLAPPPYAGVYQGGPQERGFVVILIVPDHLLNEAQQDVQNMVSFFQDKYYQQEILCTFYPINRYVPRRITK
jgi:hypothetical protein